MTLKDSVFQGSSPLRHMAELANVLSKKFAQKDLAATFIFTNGGPDHNSKHLAVQSALRALFFSSWHGHNSSASNNTSTKLDKSSKTSHACTQFGATRMCPCPDRDGQRL